jgi:hypothetical protein
VSRFTEGDDSDYSEEERLEYETEVAAAYKLASEDLYGFLTYLDSMPQKRIIADRFMSPATGAMCSVAAYCDYKGTPKSELLKTERESRYKRLADGAEDAGGDDSPTVEAGVSAGLPHLVAFELAYMTDLHWDIIQDGYDESPGVKGKYVTNSIGLEVLRATEFDDPEATHWVQRPSKQARYRPMTPDERWLTLRNYVAKKIGQSPLDSRSQA